MRCTILQRQIEVINGNRDNIIVPRVAMQAILEKELAGMCIATNQKEEIAMLFTF